MEGRAGERRQRAQIAAGLAVLLVGLVAAVASVGDSGDGVELLQILHAGAGSSAKSASGAAPEGGSSAKSQLKVLRKTYGHEESLASKMDLKVDREELAEKKPLLQAKKLMRAGMEDELAAKMDVDKASKMRAQAQKLKDKSEAARRKFVAQEKPVLLAQKLAEHDHKKYRSEELAVAKEVALLSEHPSSKKLRAKVDKLVKHSKEAKKRMAEDGMLLKKLEKKTADAQLGGAKGYSQLKQQSVKIAKKAEGIAETAVSLAKKGHTEKAKARKELKAAEKALKKPDAEYAQAKSEEKKAAHTHKVISALQDKIGKEEAAKVAKREAQKKKREAKKVTSYSEERKRLMEEVDGKAGAQKPAEKHMSDEEKQLKAAANSYNQLEEIEEKKEKARLRKEEAKESAKDKASQAKPVAKTHTAHFDEEEEKAQKIAAAKKRAHILSERQSTFLSGLFSTKSPWDTEKALK